MKSLEKTWTHPGRPIRFLEQKPRPASFFGRRGLSGRRLMPDEKRKIVNRDRLRPADGEDDEMQYLEFVKQAGITPDEARDLIKRYGNNRKTLLRHARDLVQKRGRRPGGRSRPDERRSNGGDIAFAEPHPGSTMTMNADQVARLVAPLFTTSVGILFGFGFGGSFDGVVLYQILPWHHMATSAGYPPNSVTNPELNTLLDGVFHASTYIFVALGLLMLWRSAHKSHLWWTGTMLMGFGIFNLVGGLIDHRIFDIHHVNGTSPPEQWIYWDISFLICGAAMLAGGWLLFRRGKQVARRAPLERICISRNR
jgi:uncharacterized membrane protein